MLGAGEIVGEASWGWLGAGIESPLVMDDPLEMQLGWLLLLLGCKYR